MAKGLGQLSSRSDYDFSNLIPRYELIQKGVTELRTAGSVPDVYTQIMLLDNENRNLKKDLKHIKQAADKAREDLLKTQKERDFHRMHHKRIVQEKNKLINDLKGLKLHYASYEPTIRVLHEKHHALLKEKMLTSLERDRAIGQISGLQATLKNINMGNNFHIPEIKVGHSCEKENMPEGPTQKGLRKAREQNKGKTKMKDDAKGRTYTTVSHRQSHMLSFHGEKRLFVCEHTGCGKAFAMKQNPVRRAVVHDPDKKKMKLKVKPSREKRSLASHLSGYIPPKRKQEKDSSFPKIRGLGSCIEDKVLSTRHLMNLVEGLDH
ncbi:Sperm-associated antigen 16 protein [Sciurus carolinensis]|uniref:Sperm-associated antigen 16 protein n=1 Tax=Sciurus carolinensis TaxID=30640 RepID=A0AA41MQJ3_SCICA|nr:Sperm-associated antigen 16 protein [Sciurus carolinensis]